MKPLPTAPLTAEDNLIWLLLDQITGGRQDVTLARDADRRDAALMLEAQQCAKGNGPSAVDVRGIACRGYNEHGYWIEDTEDGEGVWLR